MRKLARVLCAAALCALFWCDGVLAEVYRWTDAEGNLHFTQRLDQVPPEYRQQARESAAAEAVAPAASIQTYSRSGRSGAASAAGRYDKEIRIPFVRDGSLMRVSVRLNDELYAPFLIDTGASGVSLPSHIAEQLGIRIRSDTPHIEVFTAAGVVSRPIVTLQSVELGRARVEGLDATVNPAMQVGLLGGTFFNNFVYQVDAAEGEIILVRNDRIRGGLDEDGWRARFDSLRDPIERLDAYLESDEILPASERARLERNREALRTQLEALDQHANRVSVPHRWRK